MSLTVADAPAGLAIRGVRLWSEAVSARSDWSPGDRVLLEEACRLVDRLDRCDALISGDVKAWAQIDWPFEDAPAALVISSVVTEARQGAAELRQIVKQLAIPAGEAVAKPKSKLELLRGSG